MALVDYDLSDTDQDSDSSPSSLTASSTRVLSKRKTKEIASDLPQLPSQFHDLYASTTRLSTKDDPSLHSGKKRTFPHVAGNWPTHVYLEWYPSKAERETLDSLLMNVMAEDKSLKIKSLLVSDLNSPLPLHISLSQSIQITTDQKQHFISSLRQSIEFSGIQPFKISLTKLAWVSNSDRSRWFLVLRALGPSGNELERLLNISNTWVKKNGQPPLYSNQKSGADSLIYGKISPCVKRCFETENIEKSTSFCSDSNDFHVSIAWTLEPPSKDMIDYVASFSVDKMKVITQFQIEVKQVKVKVGNTVISISFPRCASESKGSILN